MLESANFDFMIEFSPVTITEATGDRKVFYRLSESEIFNYANKMSTINGERMIDVIPRMVVKDHGFIQCSFDKLDKVTRYELFEGNRYNISCKKQIREMLENGKVVMVYSEQYKIPTALPYVMQGTGHHTVVYVNISDFVNMDNYGNLVVQQMRNYNGLMAVLFTACAAQIMVSSSITLSSNIMDSLVMMYSAMMERSINSAIHMDSITREKVRYLATEFCLIQMYGTDKGTSIFERYRKKMFPKLSQLIISSVDDQFNMDSFDSLSLFVEELKRLYPSMKSLSLQVVYDKWIRSYGASTALSLDYIGYHLYTLCMVLFESPLVVRIALEPALDKSKGTDAYKALQALIESHI